MARFRLGLVFCVFSTALAWGQTEPPAAGLPAPPPAIVETIPPVVTTPPTITQQTTIYEPGDGLTVSMLNGQSKLKLFGQFSAIGVFSTDRPFSAGLPLLMLPPSPFGLNTNTFNLHAR